MPTESELQVQEVSQKLQVYRVSTKEQKAAIPMAEFAPFVDQTVIRQLSSDNVRRLTAAMQVISVPQEERKKIDPEIARTIGEYETLIANNKLPGGIVTREIKLEVIREKLGITDLGDIIFVDTDQERAGLVDEQGRFQGYRVEVRRDEYYRFHNGLTVRELLEAKDESELTLENPEGLPIITTELWSIFGTPDATNEELYFNTTRDEPWRLKAVGLLDEGQEPERVPDSRGWMALKRFGREAYTREAALKALMYVGTIHGGVLPLELLRDRNLLTGLREGSDILFGRVTEAYGFPGGVAEGGSLYHTHAPILAAMIVQSGNEDLVQLAQKELLHRYGKEFKSKVQPIVVKGRGIGDIGEVVDELTESLNGEQMVKMAMKGVTVFDSKIEVPKYEMGRSGLSHGFVHMAEQIVGRGSVGMFWIAAEQDMVFESGIAIDVSRARENIQSFKDWIGQFDAKVQVGLPDVIADTLDHEVGHLISVYEFETVRQLYPDLRQSSNLGTDESLFKELWKDNERFAQEFAMYMVLTGKGGDLTKFAQYVGDEKMTLFKRLNAKYFTDRSTEGGKLVLTDTKVEADDRITTLQSELIRSLEETENLKQNNAALSAENTRLQAGLAQAKKDVANAQTAMIQTESAALKELELVRQELAKAKEETDRVKREAAVYIQRLRDEQKKK